MLQQLNIDLMYTTSWLAINASIESNKHYPRERAKPKPLFQAPASGFIAYDTSR